MTVETVELETSDIRTQPLRKRVGKATRLLERKKGPAVTESPKTASGKK